MAHPFQAISQERIGKYLVPLILLTLILMFAMNWLSTPLINYDAPNGIISYELAGNINAIHSILTSWDTNAQLIASLSLGLDYLFLVTYSTTIGMGCIWASVAFTSRGSFLLNTGVLLAWGQWLAAIFDGIENAALIKLLLGDLQSPWPQVARICAIMKFALITMGLIYFIVGAFLRIFQRTSKSP